MASFIFLPLCTHPSSTLSHELFWNQVSSFTSALLILGRFTDEVLFSWPGSLWAKAQPVHIACASASTFNWWIKPCRKWDTHFSQTDQVSGAPTPPWVISSRSNTLEMQNVPMCICFHSTDRLLIGNEWNTRPACPLFDDNKEVMPGYKGQCKLLYIRCQQSDYRIKNKHLGIAS